MLYFQLVIMAGTVMLAYYFEYTDTFNVRVQGFFCYDSSYTKPYLGPEESSAIPPAVFYAVVTGVPALVGDDIHVSLEEATVLDPAFKSKMDKDEIWDRVRAAAVAANTEATAAEKITATESVLFLLQYVSEDLDNREKIIVMGDCCYLNPLVRRTFRFLGVYAFGLLATDIFVNAGQVVTGNLAPHFLTICQPNYTALGCQQKAVFINQQEPCTGNEDDVMRARKSFPSKEAALSLYAALYISMYITCTVKNKGTRLAKPALSLGLICMALLTGINRVVEYRNHWSDVIAGFIVGGAIATFMVLSVVQRFKGKPLLDEIPPEESMNSSPLISHPREENPLEKFITTQNPITFAEVT